MLPEGRPGVMLSPGEGWGGGQQGLPTPSAVTVLPFHLQTATVRQKPRTLMMSPPGLAGTW